MIQRLDQAALRRFSFRLHFDYLLNEGKEVFFNTYFTAPMGLPELKAEEKNALFAIENMVPRLVISNLLSEYLDEFQNYGMRWMVLFVSL